MLQSLKKFEGYTVSATDGDIGRVTNFLLDDDHWTVRYLVVRASGLPLLNEHKVLISPISFRQADTETEHFHVALTVDKVKSSPDVDVDEPVSRQFEAGYHQYFGYPYYWNYPGIWGTGAYPGLLATKPWTEVPVGPGTKRNDVHLRSAKELRGYHIEGTDAEIGHIDDFIVDDQSWQIRYLVIDTANWWGGKRVLVAPHWASEVNWPDRTVAIDLTRDRIKSSPEWDGSQTIDLAYETRLYSHYGRTMVSRPSSSPQERASPAKQHDLPQA